MKFVELKKQIKSGSRKSIYLLTGDDPKVIERARDIILSLVTVLPELNITRFDETADIKEIESCCKSFPVMSDLRAVYVREYKGSLEQMGGYFDNPSPSTVLVFSAASLSANFSKFISKCEIVECNTLPEDVLEAYIEKLVVSNGCRITKQAADLLIKYSLGKLAVVENETQKLCLLTDLIKEEDVKANVNADVEYKIFELSDAIGKKQGEKAIEVLNGLLSDGFAPGALFGMLESHFRRLLYVAVNREDDNLAAQLGVKEGAVRIALRTVLNYKPTTLKKIYDCIADDERLFKSGAVRDKDAIYSTVLKIINM